MIALQIAIGAFVLMELSNVLIMYFKPDFKYGNSMRTFKGWEESKEDEKSHLFVKYMVNWVANCKLIFILLLIVVLIVNNETVMMWAVVTTIISIGIYFFSLYPIIRKLDKMEKIEPKGYSKTLSYMIFGFMAMFLVALAVYLI